MPVAALQHLRGRREEGLCQAQAAVVRVHPHALHLRGVKARDARIRLKNHAAGGIRHDSTPLCTNQPVQAGAVTITVSGNRVEAHLLSEHGRRRNQQLPLILHRGQACIAPTLNRTVKLQRILRTRQTHRQIRQGRLIEAGEVLLRGQVEQWLHGPLRKHAQTRIVSIAQARLNHV